MLAFNNSTEILNRLEVTEATEFTLENKKYSYVRTNHNVQRGEFDNLTCVNFRNEEERHNVGVFYLENQIHYVETGYSLNP